MDCFFLVFFFAFITSGLPCNFPLTLVLSNCYFTLVNIIIMTIIVITVHTLQHQRTAVFKRISFRGSIYSVYVHSVAW